MASIRVGLSGWRYGGWRGVFYPPGLVQRRELAFASRHVPTIEINGSHYSLQSPASYATWHDDTPDDFIFAVKGPRYLTHMLRFRGDTAIVATANFFASGILRLGAKLGPILWQFPPTYPFDPAAFESFLQLLPADTDDALDFAHRHDTRVKVPWLEPQPRRRLRHAIEVRHPSFLDPAFMRLLRRYRAAWVISDAVADWPYAEDVTTDFLYLRLHGTETLYGGAYRDDALDRWADRLAAWGAGREPDDAVRVGPKATRRATGRDVYCYFDNDKKVQAPYDARRLMDRLAANGSIPGIDIPLPFLQEQP